MTSIYDILYNACFETDYSYLKRDLERDQVSSEKAFWMAVIQLLYTHNTFPFFQVHKLYMDLLYDRPALELHLTRKLSVVHTNSISPTQEDIQQLKKKVETAAYIRSETGDILRDILESCDHQTITIDVEVSKVHQPYLPSPTIIIQHLTDITHTQVHAGPCQYPNSTELSLALLHTIQKKVTSYFPYFLLQLGLDKLSLDSPSNMEPPEFREHRQSVSEAVKIHLVRYPWEIRLSDAQLSHIIHHEYSGRKKSSSDEIVEDLFTYKSIQKAIRRFRGESN